MQPSLTKGGVSNPSGAHPRPLESALTENIEVNNVLQLVADAAVEREAVIDEYDIDPTKEDFDHECASRTPAFDKFYSTGGPEAIIQMTEFDVNGFGKPWLLVPDHVSTSWNVGRGRKSRSSGKDVRCSR